MTKISSKILLAGSALAALALAGCGTQAAATPQASKAAEPAPVRVCQNYVTQRAYVLSLTEPTVADALKFGGWIHVDAAQLDGSTAVGRDFAEFDAILADSLQSPGTAGSDKAISAKTKADCQALGVKF